MRLLLHACCGPCLLEPFGELAANHDVTVLFANPNIQPPAEYERRRDTLIAHAREHGIECVELPYDPAAWARQVAGLEGDPARRCRACFALRLGSTARYAASEGFDAVATTLSVSPYQDVGVIDEVGEAVCADAGVRWLASDFRSRYPEATRRSRELGMYRQNYCGCLLSAVEAERERAARKAAKERARKADEAGTESRDRT